MIRKSPDINVNIDLDSYGMKWEYEGLINEINNLKSNWGDLLEIAKKEKRLRELDSVLAERCILDAWGSIEFKSTDTFESERNAKDEYWILDWPYIFEMDILILGIKLHYPNLCNASNPFVKRGGNYNNEANAGVFYSNNTNGNSNSNNSFRAVLCP